MGQKSIEDKSSNLLPSTNASNPPSQNYFLRSEEKFSLKIYTSVKVEVQNTAKLSKLLLKETALHASAAKYVNIDISADSDSLSLPLPIPSSVNQYICKNVFFVHCLSLLVAEKIAWRVRLVSHLSSVIVPD